MSVGKIIRLTITGASSFSLSWDDGRSATIDFAEIVARRRNLAPLKNSEEFCRASLAQDGWSVEWPCGIDFGSPQLRRWADEQAGESMGTAAFRHWMERNGLTLDRAGEALGLSRRTIAYYLSGEQAVPKTVMLATEGFDSRKAA